MFSLVKNSFSRSGNLGFGFLQGRAKNGGYVRSKISRVTYGSTASSRIHFSINVSSLLGLVFTDGGRLLVYSQSR